MKTPAATEVTTSALNSANSTGLVLVSIKAEPRLDSRLMAQCLGIQHTNLFAQVKAHKADFEEFGKVPFQTGPSASGQAEKFALLNEDQAYLLLTYSRNTAKTRKLKVNLVKAFGNARRAAELRHTEYLPAYHALHDAIKAASNGSPHARWHHVNANRELNKLAGLEAGQRGRAWPGALSVLNVAALLATKALMREDGRTVHERLVLALEPLQGVQEVLAGRAGADRASTLGGGHP